MDDKALERGLWIMRSFWLVILTTVAVCLFGVRCEL